MRDTVGLQIIFQRARGRMRCLPDAEGLSVRDKARMYVFGQGTGSVVKIRLTGQPGLGESAGTRAAHHETIASRPLTSQDVQNIGNKQLFILLRYRGISNPRKTPFQLATKTEAWKMKTNTSMISRKYSTSAKPWPRPSDATQVPSGSGPCRRSPSCRHGRG
jgi:hypothetical protein